MALCNPFYNLHRYQIHLPIEDAGTAVPTFSRRWPSTMLFLGSSDSLVMSSTILRHSSVEPSRPCITKTSSYMRVNEPEEGFRFFTPIKPIDTVHRMVRIIIIEGPKLDLDSLPRRASFLRFNYESRIGTSAQTNRCGFNVVSA